MRDAEADTVIAESADPSVDRRVGASHPVEQPEFRAFLSYSHQDRAQGAWLHRALETYRVPAKLVGQSTNVGPVPRRLTPIFRDREELSASADLGAEIEAALQNSMFLIVICSPDAVRSRWVDQEVLAFKRLHGESRVLALIVAGEPYSSASAETAALECLPRALRFKLGADGELSDVPAEPLAADVRPHGDGKRLARLKLVAGLTGLRLDNLVQREAQRRIRRLAAITVAALVGMVLAVGLAIYANARRIEANEQREIAERESATARAASDYLVGTFALSNPATENPRTITALSILERSAERARLELADQPVVQSRLIATLARAYINLGLYDDARDTIRQSWPAITKAGPEGIATQLLLANADLKVGRLQQGLETVQRVEGMLGPDPRNRPDLRALAAVLRGLLLAAQGKAREGIAAFDQAIAFHRVIPNPDPKKVADVLQNRGLLLSDDGQFAEAEKSLQEALAIDREVRGEHHLVTGQVWFALAQNAFLAGDLKPAEQRIAKALEVMRQVLDPDNAIIADALSMQGQIFQAQNRLPAAERSLDEAVAIYEKAFRGPHYLIGIAQVYLALVESGRGRTDAALRTLDKAKRNYDLSYGTLHANHGDLLVNRAVILAKAGRNAEAKSDCAAGLEILGKTLGPEANFTKSMAATCTRLASGLGS